MFIPGLNCGCGKKHNFNIGNKGESEFNMLDNELEFHQFDFKKSSYI